MCFRAVRALLKFGADPNLPDEFSNVYFVAREKGLNSLQGMYNFNCCSIISHKNECFVCVCVCFM